MSLPLSTYTTLTAPTLEVLQDRIHQLSSFPEGMMVVVNFSVYLWYCDLGWSCIVQEGVLSMYQLLPTEICPVVGLSIKEDFTWKVSYRTPGALLCDAGFACKIGLHELYY